MVARPFATTRSRVRIESRTALNGEIFNLLAFGFATPAMLGWLAVAAAPVLIHWLFRRHYREVTWAAMQFLQEAIRKQSRRTRFEQLLLLAVRIMVLALLVVALARPQWADAGKLAREVPPTLRVFVLDASLSMGRAAENPALGKTLFDVAKRAAKERLQRSLPGDRFVLARIAGSEPKVLIRQPTLVTSSVLEEIDRLTLTFERGNASATIAALGDIVELKKLNEQCEVIVLSDFQETSFRAISSKRLMELGEGAKREGKAPAEPSGAFDIHIRNGSAGASPSQYPPSRNLTSQNADRSDDWKQLADKAKVTLVDVGAASPDNGTVVSLATDPPLISAEQPMMVTATIRNNGSVAITGRRVDLLIDEQLVDSKRIDVPLGQDVIVEFTVPAPASGGHGVLVRLEEDSLAADNKRWLSISVRSELSILLVNGRPSGRARDWATFFVEQALLPKSANVRDRGVLNSVAPNRGMQVRTITEADLPNVEFERHDVVFLCDSGALTDSDVDRLRRFQEAGGGVIVSLGMSINLEKFNEIVGSPQGLLAVRFLEPVSGVDEDGKPTAFGFDPGDYQHPLLREFRGNPGAGLEAALIRRYVKVSATGDVNNTSNTRGQVESAVNFSSGDPAILTSSRSAGRCVLITTALDESWGEWAIWAPGFVPLVHELVQYAASGQTQSREQLVGEAIVQKQHRSANVEKLTLTRPNGDRQLISSELIEGIPTVIVSETPTPGLYLLSSSSDADYVGEVNQSERVAINVDPLESDVRRFDPVEFSKSNDLRETIAIQDVTSPPMAVNEFDDQEAASLARMLLMAVLGLLLIEQGLAWRFTFGLNVALIVICVASVVSFNHRWAALLFTFLVVAGVSAFTQRSSFPKMLGRNKSGMEGR